MRGAPVVSLTAAVLSGASLARAQSSARVDEVAVHGSRPAGRDLEETVAAQQARSLAGTHDDPVEVLQDLPGVSRPSFDSGQLIVWGASPAETQVFLDGVPIPQLFHGSALRSTVNGAMIRSVTLSSGAYGADYGRSLGGIVRIETADVPEVGAHGEVAADTLDGTAVASIAPGDRVRVEVAGRYGWAASVLKALEVRDVSDYFAIPEYRDYQAKVHFELRRRESLEAVAVGSGDHLTRTIPDPDPLFTRSRDTSTAFQRVYLHYRREFDDGARVDVVPWFGHDANSLDDRFGGNPAALDQQTWRWGLRASEQSHLASSARLGVGVDVDGSEATMTRQGSLLIPPREGDVIAFGQPPGFGTNIDTWRVNIVGIAPYVALDLDAGPLAITPGLRADAYLLETSRQTPRVGQTPSVGLSHLEGVVEPTLAARLRITPAWALLAGAGLYSQPPAAADLSAVFGTPTLGTASAVHATLGENLHINATLTAEMLGFYKWMGGLTVRNPSPTPPLARALLDDGLGRAYGVEWLLRQQPLHGFAGWIAYTIARSERRDPTGWGWRLFDYDQPHGLVVVASQTLDAWTFGVRLRYARGLPRTPVVGTFLEASSDAHQPILGAQNSIRLPDFWQLDLRLDRAFALRGGARLVLYVEGLNITGQSNGEEYVYNANYTERGTVSGLPLLVVVGIKAEM